MISKTKFAGFLHNFCPRAI